MNHRKDKMLDWTSTLTILLTVVLFITALFVKGITHDLLLEAGVFLVSTKLIIAAYNHAAATQRLEAKLSEIENLLKG